jgi:hypothetical protein
MKGASYRHRKKPRQMGTLCIESVWEGSCPHSSTANHRNAAAQVHPFITVSLDLLPVPLAVLVGDEQVAALARIVAFLRIRLAPRITSP